MPPLWKATKAVPVLILDYHASGNLVSLELLNASKCVENPSTVNVAVMGQP